MKAFLACPRGPRRNGLVLIFSIGLAGCTGTATDELMDEPDLDHMVPVQGTVTSGGKPLTNAVVTFLAGPVAGNGETDETGHYSLSTMGRKGVPPGDYTVSVSYLVSGDGKPQGLAARSSQMQGQGMLTARERIPPEYSDLGRTGLHKTVSAQGNQFDFDVPLGPAEAEEGPAAPSGEAAPSKPGQEASSTPAKAGAKAAEPTPKGQEKKAQ